MMEVAPGEDDHKDSRIGINLSPDPGFRRGEGGWVERGGPSWSPVGGWPFSDEPASAGDPRATMKAHPSALHHPRPYGC